MVVLVITDPNMAAVHGYLCADGYVIRNPPEQKHKYYYIGLRGKNLTMLKDFQQRFETVFGIRPILIEGERCKIQNKAIYERLVKEFKSFYSWEWSMPEMSAKALRAWLRAYFDCEGWVEVQPGKSRTVRAECVNERGIGQVRAALLKLGIRSESKKRSDRAIFRLNICGKDDLLKFRELVGFLHPDKAAKLDAAIASFRS